MNYFEFARLRKTWKFWWRGLRPICSDSIASRIFSSNTWIGSTYWFLSVTAVLVLRRRLMRKLAIFSYFRPGSAKCNISRYRSLLLWQRLKTVDNLPPWRLLHCFPHHMKRYRNCFQIQRACLGLPCKTRFICVHVKHRRVFIKKDFPLHAALSCIFWPQNERDAFAYSSAMVQTCNRGGLASRTAQKW